MAIINHKIYVFHLVVFIASVIDDVHFKGSSIYIMLLLDIENFSSLFFFFFCITIIDVTNHTWSSKSCLVFSKPIIFSIYLTDFDFPIIFYNALYFLYYIVLNLHYIIMYLKKCFISLDHI